MPYRAEATSVEGFVQQIACSYLRHGYWFYVTGRIPAGKDPRAVDEKLIAKYGIAVSESTRARRKQAGRANLQYLRHERFFVILATQGVHPFFSEEGSAIRDIRRLPLSYAGYSISYRRGGLTRQGKADAMWHAHVRMDRRQYLDCRAWFCEWATRASVEELGRAFATFPAAAYAPVRRQLLLIHRAVNRLRSAIHRPIVPVEALPLRRRVVRPFVAETEPLLIERLALKSVVRHQT
jgi:hypothetical protein